MLTVVVSSTARSPDVACSGHAASVHAYVCTPGVRACTCAHTPAQTLPAQVCDPSMGAPTASACVLVVALEQELMARELQQLQPSCEAQAQQEASAHAWELLQQWGRSEPARQDLGMEMDAPPGRCVCLAACSLTGGGSVVRG